MNVRYVRRYSYFTPSHTYAVLDADGRWIGEVARNASGETAQGNERRTWYASNKTWTAGADLPGTFPTRRQAAAALQSLSPNQTPNV